MTLGLYSNLIEREMTGSVYLLPNATSVPHWFSSEAFLPSDVKLAGLMYGLAGSLLQHRHIFLQQRLRTAEIKGSFILKLQLFSSPLFCDTI